MVIGGASIHLPPLIRQSAATLRKGFALISCTKRLPLLILSRLGPSTCSFRKNFVVRYRICPFPVRKTNYSRSGQVFAQNLSDQVVFCLNALRDAVIISTNLEVVEKYAHRLVELSPVEKEKGGVVKIRRKELPLLKRERFGL